MTGNNKYKLTVNGDTRHGEYCLYVSGSKDTLQCDSIELVEKGYKAANAEDIHGDILHVEVERIGAPISDMARMTWVVLSGTVDEAIEAVETILPMAKFEANALFEAFEEGEGRSLCYTYPLLTSHSKIMLRENNLRIMRLVQQEIVADLWGKKLDEVMLIEPEYS